MKYFKEIFPKFSILPHANYAVIKEWIYAGNESEKISGMIFFSFR